MKIIKKIKPFFIDERGEMSYLLNNKGSIKSTLLITSKKGSIRANHYHKKDAHYVYLLKGKMEYTYQNVKIKGSKKKTLRVEEGDMVYTPPMTMHAMEFLEDTVFIALTTEKRMKGAYEKDTMRIKLL